MHKLNVCVSSKYTDTMNFGGGGGKKIICCTHCIPLLPYLREVDPKILHAPQPGLLRPQPPLLGGGLQVVALAQLLQSLREPK